MKNGFIEIPASKRSMSSRKAIYGVGINDANYQTRVTINNKSRQCQFYMKWTSMIQRAYSDEFHRRQPSYKDVIICKEWHLFSNFKRWMEQQDWKNKELDKDIIYPDNKVYSPETCCFIDRELNLLLTDRKKARGKYPIGVSLLPSNRFQAQIGVNGKLKYIGSFDTENEAHQSYLKAKIAYIKTFIPTVTKRIQNGLGRHIVLLEKQLTKGAKIE